MSSVASGDGTAAAIDGQLVRSAPWLRRPGHRRRQRDDHRRAPSADNQNAVAIEGSHAAVRGNEFLDNYTSLSLSDSSSELSGNRIQGGVIGIEIEGSGEPLVVGNSLEDARSRGIVIGGGTSPVIEGNSVCGSVVNLVVDAGAQPTIGDNDICPDGTTAG